MPALLGLLLASSSLSAGDPLSAPAHFLGDASCSSSSCHGGAGDKRNQCLTWSRLDFHFTRPYATLTTGRSARLADTLKIANPAADARCTVCHAPFQTVAPARLAADSCAS